jgi:hypothetical protein
MNALFSISNNPTSLNPLAHTHLSQFKDRFTTPNLGLRAKKCS